MTFLSNRRRRVGVQATHAAGTCAPCRGTGTAPAPPLSTLTLLPCGPCGGTGSSR